MSKDERIRYFFQKARDCLRQARGYQGKYRPMMIQVAMQWRELAKQTRWLRSRL